MGYVIFVSEPYPPLTRQVKKPVDLPPAHLQLVMCQICDQLAPKCNHARTKDLDELFQGVSKRYAATFWAPPPFQDLRHADGVEHKSAPGQPSVDAGQSPNDRIVSAKPGSTQPNPPFEYRVII